MREDMHKLLCERPRNGHKDRDGDREIPARRYSQRLELVRGEDEDGEYVESNSPSSMKMGKGCGGTKELNENLNPLYRWLDKQVNRPWDKVYSELRERIDVRSAVQLHIMEHVWDYVERDVEIVDGAAYAKIDSWNGRGMGSGQLYVNPETGILCRVKKVKSKSKGYQQDPRVIKVDDLTFLCQIKGIWYEVTYSHKPPKSPSINRVWSKSGGYKDTEEIVLKFEAQYRNLSDLEKRAYKSWWIPFAKVQLSSKDLRKRGLQNQTAA